MGIHKCNDLFRCISKESHAGCQFFKNMLPNWIGGDLTKKIEIWVSSGLTSPTSYSGVLISPYATVVVSTIEGLTGPEPRKHKFYDFTPLQVERTRWLLQKKNILGFSKLWTYGEEGFQCKWGQNPWISSVCLVRRKMFFWKIFSCLVWRKMFS